MLLNFLFNPLNLFFTNICLTQAIHALLAHISSKQLRSSYRFTWLVVLTQIAENPNEYNFIGYKAYFLGFGVIILFAITFFLVFKHEILSLFYKIFLYALQKRFSKNIICYYCFFIIKLRGVFEFQPPYLIFFFSAPNMIYLYFLFFQEKHIFSEPIIWASFWFSLGILLISWDQLGAKIVSLCQTDPNHPFAKAFHLFVQQSQTARNNFVIQAGWIPAFGKMTAAGQAALFSGTAAVVGTMFVTGVNIWHNERRDLRQQAKETADRKTNAEKETLDRKANAEKETLDRKTNAEKEALDRKANAEKEALDRKAQADRRERKYEQQREQRREQHERDRERWAHEEKMSRPWWRK